MDINRFVKLPYVLSCNNGLICSCVCLSVSPSVRPSVRLSVCLSVRLSVCPSVTSGRPSVFACAYIPCNVKSDDYLSHYRLPCYTALMYLNMAYTICYGGARDWWFRASAYTIVQRRGANL